jgi:hypothetical protein
MLAADVREIVEGGDTRQIKALLQAYVKEITVSGRDEIYPSFLVPAVSPPSYSVEAAGIEPAQGSSRRDAGRWMLRRALS